MKFKKGDTVKVTHPDKLALPFKGAIGRVKRVYPATLGPYNYEVALRKPRSVQGMTWMLFRGKELTRSKP